ncbi:MAG: hypothetical protein U0556_09920 [Dehalococcoidia bacterium]
MPNQITKQTAQVGALRVGGGSRVRKVQTGTLTVDPAEILAGAAANTAVTLTGVAVGDIVVVEPPADLEAGLVPIGAIVTDADEVSLRLYNPTIAAVDGAEKAWRYLWVDLT